MKKILLIALAAAVFCLPTAAMAKADFELGGYIRLDAIWNSQQGIGHTLAAFCPRNNLNGANHGRFQMNANATRFNLTMKGPELWGGKVTGFIEVDFDGQTGNLAAANGLTTTNGSFNQAVLRLRHAMFKINWPDREVLFGQYWSINSEMTPETADSGAYCLYGATQVRLPQVRYTQKFTDAFDASLAICSPQNGRWGLNVDQNNPNEGELSETPMFEAKARFEQDLYGKAAWYGKPRGFYVGLGGGYFRSRNQGNTAFAAATWQAMGVSAPFVANYAAQPFAMNINNTRYANHWLVILENFAPIIPTTSKNISGTMAFSHQWWVGQGVSAWRLDLPANDRYWGFNGFNGPAGIRSYDYDFIKRWGGNAQLQYYWTNEIFTNVNFGFQKAFGFGPGTDAALVNAANLKGSVYGTALGYDPVKMAWRASITQWYRPVSAVKFALQYAFMQTDYFQRTTVGSQVSNTGYNHSVMANAWYMF
jgi:hypothetical protein